MSTSNLPPSTEEAYRKKCIELRRRMQEVEENNDATRLRRARLVRGIRKMRIERAILLDSLAKRMRKNGTHGTVFDEDSEDSTEAPPTPTERPLRVKKSHRRMTDMSSPPPIPSGTESASMQAPISGGFSTQNDPFAISGSTTSRYTRADLLPTREIVDGTPSQRSAVDLFAAHFTSSVAPRYSIGGGDVADELQDTWESLPNDIRKAWETAEQSVKSNLEKSKAAEDWKKTVGNRSRSSGVKPVELDDDDVIMVGAEEVTRR